MKIKILKSQEDYWYANQIGSIFNVIDFTIDDYKLDTCRGDSGLLIGKSDCEILSREQEG